MQNQASLFSLSSVLLIGALTGACRDPRPRSLALFDGCLAGGIESLRHGEQQLQIECSVGEPLFLVGLPGRKITVDELLKAGLSKDLADILATSTSQASRWCAVEEFEYKPPTPADKTDEVPIARSNCFTTDLEIDQVVHTRASKMRLSLVKSPSGQITLDTLEPL